jgi:SAM-dependent methyltransferase
LLNKLRRLFAPALAARRALAHIRPPLYAPLAALRASQPAPVTDLPREEVERINARSDDYFDNPSLHDFWMSKPLSDLRGGPDNLWRFGLILSALQVGPGDRVLDFGCGSGWTSMLLAQTGAEVTGMDISARALGIAESMAAATHTGGSRSRPRFQPFDGLRIDAPDGYFDFVIVFDALHHLPNLATVLSEACRVLGPHGCLGFAEPGVGHSHSYTSAHEIEWGVLENEIDPDRLWATGRAAGFQELELLVPPVPAALLTLPMRRARWFLRGMPGIVPQDFIRTMMLSYPTGFLRKGPYTSTSLHPHALLAAIRPSVRTMNVRAGETFRVTAAVQNLTGTVWLREGARGRGAVRLGARLLGGAEQAPGAELGRCALPGDTPHGAEHQLHLDLVAPSVAGEYVIRLDMIDEGIAWFSERGSAAADIGLRVS